jgi:hypothetical protein
MLLPLVLAAGCGRHPDPSASVHTLTLPAVAPAELPDVPGRPMLVGACSTCHTLRYVLDQPPLSRRQWAAEVDKMRRTYGASFPDEMSVPIVDYLVATHGTEPPG